MARLCAPTTAGGGPFGRRLPECRSPDITRAFLTAVVLFIGGLAAVHYGSMVLGVALLILAVHYAQQSNKSHTLLILTAYHRATVRSGCDWQGHPRH